LHLNGKPTANHSTAPQTSLHRHHFPVFVQMQLTSSTPIANPTQSGTEYSLEHQQNLVFIAQP